MSNNNEYGNKDDNKEDNNNVPKYVGIDEQIDNMLLYCKNTSYYYYDIIKPSEETRKKVVLFVVDLYITICWYLKCVKKHVSPYVLWVVLNCCMLLHSMNISISIPSVTIDNNVLQIHKVFVKGKEYYLNNEIKVDYDDSKSSNSIYILLVKFYLYFYVHSYSKIIEFLNKYGEIKKLTHVYILYSYNDDDRIQLMYIDCNEKRYIYCDDYINYTVANTDENTVKSIQHPLDNAINFMSNVSANNDELEFESIFKVINRFAGLSDNRMYKYQSIRFDKLDFGCKYSTNIFTTDNFDKVLLERKAGEYDLKLD